MSNHPKLHDRIKQFSNTENLNPIQLDETANGFATFRSVYSDGDKLFYAVTDGTNFEVGSGVFNSGVTLNLDNISRNVIVSSNSNQLINFGTGRKEIYVTYPATHSVLSGSGLAGFGTTSTSGVAFWGAENILNYDSNIVWDNTYKYLGIRKDNPAYAIDIGGDGSSQSMVQASGFSVGPTGIHFPANNGNDSNYIGGIQYKHFLPNELSDVNTQAVIQLSGIVNQKIEFKDQVAGTFFAGPESGCAEPCSPAAPSFRQIVLEDLPDLSNVYSTPDMFSVTANAGKYVFNNVGTSNHDNPALNLQKGSTYKFNIDATGHPFFIGTTNGAINGNPVSISAYNDGVTNNGIDSGIISFTVRQDAPSVLYYNCSNHYTMSGIIYTRDSNAGSGLLHTLDDNAYNLDDPVNHYTELSGIHSTSDDKVLTWDESESAWKYMNWGEAMFAPSGKAYIKGLTPTSATPGLLGEMVYDQNYLYVYSSDGWRKALLYGIDETPTVPVATTSTTAPPQGAPQAPTALSASAGNGLVDLSWTAPPLANPLVNDYVIETGIDGVTYGVYPDLVSAATTAQVTGLTNTQTYYFRVAAANVVSTGAFSAAVTATPTSTSTSTTSTTLPPTPGNYDTTITIPSSLSATAESVQVSVPDSAGVGSQFSFNKKTVPGGINLPQTLLVYVSQADQANGDALFSISVPQVYITGDLFTFTKPDGTAYTHSFTPDSVQPWGGFIYLT